MVMALPQNLTDYGLNRSSKSEPFDRDVIVCPDMLAQNLEEGTPYPSTLRPIVDAVWQAAGRKETPYTAEWKVDRADNF